MTGTTRRNSPNKGGGPYPYQTGADKRWHFVATVTLPDGTRRKVHKRGFATSAATLKAMRELLTASDKGQYT
jgi:Arm DNA-binding domain